MYDNKTMNIFVLDSDPIKASVYHTDKHIVKMPLETAQMLCTAIYLDGSDSIYKPTHKKHPCNLWLMQSLDNYFWLCQLGFALCEEYSYRYKKTHACEKVIRECYKNFPNIESIGITPHALAMPNECKISDDAVICYREYYNVCKQHLFSWKERETPFFINK